MTKEKLQELRALAQQCVAVYSEQLWEDGPEKNLALGTLELLDLDLIDKQREALEEFIVAWHSDQWALREDAIVKKVREALDLVK